jgi:putative membrane protein
MGYGGMGGAGMMDGMMNMGGMSGFGMGLWGQLTMLIFWVAFILLIIWLVRTVVGAGQRETLGPSGAKGVLDERYARGEITRKEYLQLKKDIAS